MRKIGILTSGGDSPGMNTAVMSVAKSAAYYGVQLVGIKRGYNGLIRKSTALEQDMQVLDLDTVLDIADLPGTYLRTARCDEFLDPAYRAIAVDTLHQMGIDSLVVVGGDGSFRGAEELCKLGIPCIGIPGTIDNDLPYTEMTLGFDTAVNVCVQAVRSIRATSRSHDRPAVVEVMGRHCGDIALHTAAATGAEIVLVPEVPWSVEEVADRLNRLIQRGNTRATIVMAEGCYESMAPFDLYAYLNARGKACFAGEPMSASRFASVMKRMCGAEVRATVIGYTQRGAEPTALDSVFAFGAGHLAVRLLHEGVSNQVIGAKKNRIFHTPIEEALQEKKVFNHTLYELVNAV